MWAISKELLQQANIDKSFAVGLLDNLPALVTYWDTSLRCRFANKICDDWFGRPSSDVVGMRKKDLIGRELFLENEIHISQVLIGHRQKFCRTLITARGHSLKILSTYVPAYDKNHLIVGFSVLAADVTDLERRLAQIATRTSNSTGEPPS